MLFCKKSQSESDKTMFIIGEDPCTRGYALNKGFVVKLSHSQDTVVTYNLPESIQEQINNSVKGTDFNFLFPKEKILKVNLAYRFATEEEKIWPLCLANISLAGFSRIHTNQIIILNEPPTY